MEPFDKVKGARWDLGLNDGAERNHVAPLAILPFNPVFRGFWLDDDLMEVSGIGSVAVLKKLQAKEAIEASYIALTDGGRRRAWTARNVFRALLVKEISDLARMSLIAAGLLIGKIGPGFIDRELQLDQLLDDLKRRIDNWAKVSKYRGQLPGTVRHNIGPAGNPALVIANWQDVRFAKAEEEYSVASIRKLDGAAPVISPIPKALLPGETRVITRIPIHPIVTSFVRAISH